MLTRLAIRNIFRHRVRSAMTLAAIALGVAGLILAGGFVQDIFVQLGEAVIHSQYGHAQVSREGFMEKGTRNPTRYLIEQPEALTKRIRGIEGVDDVMARISFAGVINNGRRDYGIVGEGVEPAKEARLGSMITVLAGRMLDEKDLDGIMIGEGVATAMGVTPGERINLLINTAEGALNTLDFEVIGVFRTFSKDFDAHAVRIPLGAAQDLLQTPGANVLVVSLHRTDDTDAFMPRLQASLAGMPLEARSWRKLSDFYDKTRELYARQFGVLQLIILGMVLLGVSNTVNMSIFERVAEFGTVRALGDRPIDVLRSVLLEHLMLGLLGAALGVALGLGAAWLASWVGIPMPPPPNANTGYLARIQVLPMNVLLAAVIGVAATVLAALLPAWRVSRTPVVDALRQSV
ncbi:ABC transporter permease [Uliginosibacterium sp. H1]|uniref:ABC transporter permease n=1 Tax=Uliginosibacterium sp. H1 TaxID=3114757 RepID=UPI002E174A3B|nr:ABC transporter permease [Uliginosibacterium sp. H1]